MADCSELRTYWEVRCEFVEVPDEVMMGSIDICLDGEVETTKKLEQLFSFVRVSVGYWLLFAYVWFYNNLFYLRRIKCLSY